MNRKEFINSLREYLSYELPERLVSANVRKYEEYFEDQIKAGKTASQVAEELGDPKLIARSCIDAAKSGKDGIPNSEDDENFAQEMELEKNRAGNDQNGGKTQNGSSQFGNTRVYTSKGCLIPILVLIVIIIIIVLIFVSGLWLWIVLGALIISAVTALIQLIRKK